MHLLKFPFQTQTLWEESIKMNHAMQFALGKLLVFAALFNAQKSMSQSRMQFALLLVDCADHDGNYLAASVFFNVHIVSKSRAEFSPPIGAFMELLSNANLPCLVNLRLKGERVWGEI